MVENSNSPQEVPPAKEKPNVVWDVVFVILGILSSLVAFCQIVLQIYALRIAVQFEISPYIWFFCLDTWATIIYLGYTIRLLYLVRLRRSEDLSRIWWYIAVVLLVVSPAEGVWWWLREDYLLLYASVPACLIYLSFFVLVCRSMASGIKEKIKRKLSHRISRPDSSIEMHRGTGRLVTSV